MNKIYTGIGSRETPTEILTLMTQIGVFLAQAGWILRSGHAEGADQAFEHGALFGSKNLRQMEIYLPWPKFEDAPDVLEVIHNECAPNCHETDEHARDELKGYIAPNIHCPETYDEALRVAEMFHPAWGKCSSGAKKLHARNVYQVAGQDLLTASKMVVCWTKDGKRGGGTGQALRMAEYLKIPIFDLAVCSPEELHEFICKKTA